MGINDKLRESKASKGVLNLDNGLFRKLILLITYAVALVREAEIAGRVGTETTRRAAALTDSTGLDPDIRWSTTGRIQLNDEVTVTLTLETDIGLFGGFGSFPITLTASATGKSEVYWK